MLILSTLAVKGALQELVPLYGGAAPQLRLDPTALLMQSINSGSRADLAILTRAGIDTLSDSGVLSAESVRDVAISSIGIAVRQGAAMPDISSVEAVRALLLSVPSLCYSRSGASGLHFAKVIRQLGIADEVERKANIIASGFTAEAVADGRCEIAVQQVSELLVVPGIAVVGALPAAINETMTFSAAIFTDASASDEAREFLDFITDPRHAGLYRRHGLELARGPVS